MSVRFIIFGFNGNFALEKRLNIWKQKNFGVGQISDTTKDIESSRTIKSSKPQHFLCGKLLLWLGLRPICSFSITISSSSSPLFFFSDDIQHVTRHKSALLSTRHSDETTSFALAAHADLARRSIQCKTFQSGKYQHTFTPQKQIHAESAKNNLH